MAAENNSNFNYIITETNMPNSFDPLDADKTQNLPAVRMIYATPLEMDNSDRLTSLVLESFKYEPKDKTITWMVKNGIKYSDGTPITPADIAFAVTRMAYIRPKFPVLEHIVGLADWLKMKNPMTGRPSGIQVSDNKITIKLVKNVPHPLFRFSLELFSIIPQKCVDAKTNKISCSSVPASGRYHIVTKNEREIHFEKRPDAANNVPAKITFKYMSPSAVVSQLTTLDSHTAVAGNEVMYSLPDISHLKNSGTINFLPSSRFALILINPEMPPFNDVNCRNAFAQEFRNQYTKIVNGNSIGEESLFTKILPGYLAKNEFQDHSHASAECKSKFKSLDIKWGYVDTEADTPFVITLKQTMKALQIDSVPQTFPNRQAYGDALTAGKINFMNFNSGFWSLDPSGDLQMLFTPNLHQPLNHLSGDSKFQALIKDVAAKPDDLAGYVKVNRYLHDGAIFNVYAHVRRFYFSTNKSLLREGQFGISAPTPWEIFR